MTKKEILIDALHLEEVRVALVTDQHIEEFELETTTKKQKKGNIYLGKIVRVEPSLQAAFIDYGDEKHGFISFDSIHPDYYQIPVSDQKRTELSLVHSFVKERISTKITLKGIDKSCIKALILADQSLSLAQLTYRNPRLTKNQFDQLIQMFNADSSVFYASHTYFIFTKSPSIHIKFTSEKNKKHIPSLSESLYNLTHHHASSILLHTNLSVPAHKKTARANLSIRAQEKEHQPEPPIKEPKKRLPLIGELSDFSEEKRKKDNPLVLPMCPQKKTAHESQSSSESAPFRRKRRNQKHSKSNHLVVESHVSDVIECIDIDEKLMPISFNYKIQEVIRENQLILVQVVKEERGNKGAALTSYISLAGRYSVLMPNTPKKVGISKKITDNQERKRFRDILTHLNLPDIMSIIIRTAGSQIAEEDIVKDIHYAVGLWDHILEKTFTSTAPALIHEEANIIKRSLCNMYSKDIGGIWVAGQAAYEQAKNHLETLIPEALKILHLYEAPMPLFQKYKIEEQLAQLHKPSVQLNSGGSIVIQQTEALVSIDINSGKSTQERHIQATALKTNLEAAQEIARQLRLRDLSGLIVIDFIDMEDERSQELVVKKLQEHLSTDRARINLGSISQFGLLEMSRQRMRPSFAEHYTEICHHCQGSGLSLSTESLSLSLLRRLEETAFHSAPCCLKISINPTIATFLLNTKRETIQHIESTYGCTIQFIIDAKQSFDLEDIKIQVESEKKEERKKEKQQTTKKNQQQNESSPSKSKEKRAGKKTVAAPELSHKETPLPETESKPRNNKKRKKRRTSATVKNKTKTTEDSSTE